MRISKNHKIGVSKFINVVVPFSPTSFANHFVHQLAVLANWDGMAINRKVFIEDLKPVLGERWYIAQNSSSSTQARVLGKVSLKFYSLSLQIQQRSFNG